MRVPILRSSAPSPFLDRHHDYRHRIRNKHGEKALDLVKPGDEVVLELFRKAQAEASIAKDDIACTFRRSCPPRFLLHCYTR